MDFYSFIDMAKKQLAEMLGPAGIPCISGSDLDETGSTGPAYSVGELHKMTVTGVSYSDYERGSYETPTKDNTNNIQRNVDTILTEDDSLEVET